MPILPNPYPLPSGNHLFVLYIYKSVFILLVCFIVFGFVFEFYFFYRFLKKVINLFLAVLGLRFCARAFSSCSERGPLFIAVHGPLTVAVSPIAEHGLQTRRLSSCGSQA